jgi:hypothetical protein
MLIRFAGAFLFGIGSAFFAPACLQTVDDVPSCGACVEGDFGGGSTPRPSGFVFTANMSTSCQGSGNCADCCMELEATVSGTSACAVEVGIPGGALEVDTTGPIYYVSMKVKSKCLETANTFECGYASGGWNCTPGAGNATKLCFKLNCYQCQ